MRARPRHRATAAILGLHGAELVAHARAGSVTRVASSAVIGASAPLQTSAAHASIADAFGARTEPVVQHVPVDAVRAGSYALIGDANIARDAVAIALTTFETTRGSTSVRLTTNGRAPAALPERVASVRGNEPPALTARFGAKLAEVQPAFAAVPVVVAAVASLR